MFLDGTQPLTYVHIPITWKIGLIVSLENNARILNLINQRLLEMVRRLVSSDLSRFMFLVVVCSKCSD